MVVLWVMVLGVGAWASWPSAGDGAVAWVARESKMGQWVVLRVSGTPPAMRVEVAGWMPRPVVAIGGDASRCVAALRREAGWVGVREIEAEVLRIGATAPANDGREMVEFGPARVLPPIGGGVRAVDIEVAKDSTRVFVVPEGESGTDAAGSAPGGWLELADNQWRGVAGEPPAMAGISTFEMGGSRFAAEREGEDVVIRMLGADGTGRGEETARVRGVPRDSAVFALGGGDGGQVVALWEHDDGALWYASVSPLGLEVGRGPVSRSGPLPGREAVTLALGLFWLFASVAVWVLVPAKWREPVAAPEGFTYAERSRRAAATVIDLLPGFMVGEVAARWVSWAPADVVGVWPAVLALVVTVVLCGVCEGASGVTLGKWAMRCRAVMPDGSRMSWRRAVLRNAVKFACPPLGLLNLVVPAWKWSNPAGVGTVVVVGGEDVGKSK